MNPEWFDADLALRFFETVLWAVVWVIAAIFVCEVLGVVVLCRGRPGSLLKKPLGKSGDIPYVGASR